jgi:hypothetical protein
MQIPSIEPIRNPSLMYHVTQGGAWLNACAHGDNPTALSYAAFEFRLAVERLAIHYWAALLNRKIETRDLSDRISFKTVEGRIYELGGHQQKINRHFSLVNILLDALSISQRVLAPDINKLSKHWHYCSEFCHIAWTFASGDCLLRLEAEAALREIEQFLSMHIANVSGWPTVNEPNFEKLRDRFVAGEADDDEIRLYLKEIGVWARVEYSDGRPPEFVGTAIPPSETGHKPKK